MYIIKNAFKCIGRTKGRNILIGVIVLVIAVSACLGLSIRQAAESAKADTLDGMSVTATISYDRQSMMGGMKGSLGEGSQGGEMPSGGFDREQFAEMMGQSSSLTLAEYEKYAAASTVKDFYYTLTASANGNDDLLPVSNESDTDSDTTSDANGDKTGGDFSSMPDGGRGGFGNKQMGVQSDFSVVGYSSEAAMTAFVEGTATITDGVVFTEGTAERECVISQELAIYNDLAVGDSITLTNPNDEEQLYTFTVVGIYSDTSANESSFSIMGSTATDPANQIYTSYAALLSVLDASEQAAETLTDEDTGREYSTEMSGTLSATYTFADVDAYETFEQEVRTLGLDDSYTVSSADLQAYENSLVPLETLSTMAGYFLIVILIIGAIILVVLNIFNVRERKYEIGVLTAMGMKKGKVALQFLTESFAVTLAAVIIGVGIGGVTALPVTNALLENQIASQDSRAEQVEGNFGRGSGGGAGDMPTDGGETPQMPSDGRGGMGEFFGGAADYISEINSAMNFTVVLQMLGIAVLLTLVAGAVSMLFVMRYDPLRILANRD